MDVPPSHGAVVIEGSRAEGAGSTPGTLLQDPQPTAQIPGPDFVVEVIGKLPLQAQIQDVSRLLGQRHLAGSTNRVYLPTILELIMLVERNPERPRGRAWNSIGSISLGYDADTSQVSVNYCVDYCGHDPKTGATHPKRKTVTYSAPEQVVASRVAKKLDELKKYAR